MQPQSFIFEQYRFDAASGELRLIYAYDNGLKFEEVITFKPPFHTHDLQALDRLFRLLFLLAGMSYYKAYVPQKLVCEAFALDAETAQWMERVYTSGLGEFAYRNGLDLRRKIYFESKDAAAEAALSLKLPNKALVPIGGGKDSVVTLEALKAAFCNGKNPYKRESNGVADQEDVNPYKPIEGLVGQLIGSDQEWGGFWYPVMLYLACLLHKTNFETLK